MELPVVPAAERYCELIANFKADGPRLSKPEVMGVGRLSSTDEAWLRCNKLEVCLITKTLGFSKGELALVDPTWKQIGPGRN